MNEQRRGFIYALGAYGAWGVFPLYFKALKGVHPLEILAHRVAWSAVFLAVLVTAQRRWSEVGSAFRSGRSLAVYALSTAFVTTNWLLYIWAVVTGHVLEASLGYFMNPLVNVLLGALFLRETLRPRQIFAVTLAALGVVLLVVRVGHFPWLALTLAFSFGSYGLVRKRAAIDPIVGLLVETSLLAPFAAGLIAWRTWEGTGGLGQGTFTASLLLMAGVITAIPLIWFAHGMRNLRLATMGLIQFVTPTLQFLFAVLLYREPFTSAHAVAFCCIWASLAIYTADALFTARRHLFVSR
ncbi:MAG: EamA family transporter RarD [Polyangiaceae bacterium]